jgi:deoxyadenosine/deoxycytidine kinase
MATLIAVVGASGVGKTALVQALAKAYPFEACYEDHSERPFQALFKHDARYALANQIDYFLLRAGQEKRARQSPGIGLIDGGLDLDFHCFTRLFHSRGMLTDPELDLCRRTYELLRELLPGPELFIRLQADQETVTRRLAQRDRINVATAEDTALCNSFLEPWLASLAPHQVLHLNVAHETPAYEQSVNIVLETLYTSGYLTSNARSSV